MTYQLEIRLIQPLASYEILIGEGLLMSAPLVELCHSLGSKGAIISDFHVEHYYGRLLRDYLITQGLEMSLFSFAPGEKQKTRQTKEILENQLLENGLGRDTFLIALGGGIVTDLTGFLASTYCRGIPFFSVPTSLLAMVDASIGGKTGVNVAYGKNMIGTLYQPSAIMMDSATLKTLPDIELKNGIVEIIKHGLILDASYFELLETHSQQILNLEPPLIEKIIYQSCLLKRQVVVEDEHEKGQRRLLNFGHTIGHAIEILTDYQVPHGQAVALGIVGESYLSMQLGYLSSFSFNRIINIFKDYQIQPTLGIKVNPTDFIRVMKLDKKSLRGTPRFVVLEEIGKCLAFDSQFCTTIDEKILINTLEWICINN